MRTDSADRVQLVVACHGETESLDLARIDFDCAMRVVDIARPLAVAFLPDEA